MLEFGLTNDYIAAVDPLLREILSRAPGEFEYCGPAEWCVGETMNQCCSDCLAVEFYIKCTGPADDLMRFIREQLTAAIDNFVEVEHLSEEDNGLNGDYIGVVVWCYSSSE